MSQFPPTQTPPFPPQGYPHPQPSRTNGAAIASLICGILGCFLITSFAAVILGIVGIKGSASRQGNGKAMAIIGLVLGILGILAWSAAGGGAYMFYRASAQPRAVARQFIQDLAANKIDAAKAVCDPSITREELVAESEALQQLGTFQSVTLVGVSGNNTNGVEKWEIGGAAVIGKTTKAFRAVLNKEGDNYRIEKFEFE